MDLSPEEKRGITSAIVGAAVFVVALTLLAGLTRAGIVSAFVAAIVATAAVVGAIFFRSAYRRASSPPVSPLRPSPYREEWLDSEEGLEERPQPLEEYAREEREGPPPPPP